MLVCRGIKPSTWGYINETKKIISNYYAVISISDKYTQAQANSCHIFRGGIHP